MKLYKILTFVSLLLCTQNIFLKAQKSIRFTEPSYRLNEAVKLIDIQFYEQAYLLLDDYLTQYRQDDKMMRELDQQKALYYFYLCALKLNKPSALQHFNDFINNTLYIELGKLGNFQLGKFYYEHNLFELAIKNYEAAGIEVLTNQELTQRNFELGYSYLVTQQLNKVEPFFQSAKSIKGDYFKPGNYYHGLMAYYNKDYADARESFNAVKDDERYRKIVPFYLTEIDYLTGKKEKALTDALRYLSSSEKLYYDAELNRMVAQIYCEQEDYANAEKYFYRYITLGKSIKDEDYFKLGYCRYQQGKTDKAIQSLEQVSAVDTAISQHAYYILALCYLKKGNKEKAYERFNECKNISTDEKQKELIQFTLSKLSYDKGDDKTAFTELKAFVKAFPNSEYFDEANELLAYLNIKYENFNDAVFAMNKLKNISPNLKKVYQKANYARGIQLLKEENADRAIFNFLETKKFPVDEITVSLATFWLAECNYRLGRYLESMSHCDLFLNHVDTNAMPEYTKKIHQTKAFIYFHNNQIEDFINEYSLGSGDTNTTDLSSRVGSMKPNYIPESIPVVDNTPYIMVYNLPEEEINFIYKPIPLKPLALANEIKGDDKTNFLKLGLGNLSTFDLAAGYNVDKLVNMPLYIDFNRSTRSGKIKFQDVSQTHLGFYTNTSTTGHAIDLAFEIDRNKYNYYGYDRAFFNLDNQDIRQVFHQVGLSAKILPLKMNRYDINYSADLYTGIYTDKFNAGEYTVKADIPVSKKLKDDLIVHSDVIVDMNVYSLKDQQTQSNSIFSWRPSFIKQLNQLTLKAGIQATAAKQFYLLPDLSISHSLMNNTAIAELAWVSYLRLNTFKQLTELNPFIFNQYKVTQSKNSEFTAGLKGTISNNCSYAFRSGIALFDQLPLFLNDTSSDNKQFNILFEKRATAFLLDASVDYTIHSEMLAGFKLNMRPLLNMTENKEAWHYIPATMAVYGKIRATKDVVISADLYLMAGSKAIEKNQIVTQAYTKTLSSGLDLNLAARYAISQRWNVLIDINNVFGSNYQRWYGYPMYGTNVVVGIIHRLKSLNLDHL